jgi:hypothetical protein
MIAFLEVIALGWVLGHVAGTLVRRRAARRGIRVDATDLAEKWGLLFAVWAAMIAAATKIV